MMNDSVRQLLSALVFLFKLNPLMNVSSGSQRGVCLAAFHCNPQLTDKTATATALERWHLHHRRDKESKQFTEGKDVISAHQPLLSPYRGSQPASSLQVQNMHRQLKASKGRFRKRKIKPCILVTFYAVETAKAVHLLLPEWDKPAQHQAKSHPALLVSCTSQAYCLMRLLLSRSRDHCASTCAQEGKQNILLS